MESPVLEKLDPNYPKAKYSKVPAGETGDVKSPAYEKIVTQGGEAKRVVEFHNYVSISVKNAKEEKQLGPEWVDHPKDLK